MQSALITRRQFLLSWLGWFPFFRRRHITLAGIRFRILHHGSSPRRYLLIHGNEFTARELLTEHMKRAAGIAHGVTGADRYITTRYGRFDPNRIFSREGAEKNARLVNPGISPSDFDGLMRMLDRDRGKLLERLLPAGGALLVALHNNSQGYSVKDEVPISDRVSLADEANPHEFMLATDPQDFERLARSPYNVVLQQKAPPEDDGSLSRLAARRNIRYVNLETGLGKLDKQREMLAWIESHLPR